MAPNQPPWPTRWLMTDERIGERLWAAIDRLPAGSGGIVFRHYSLGPVERLALGREIASAAKARGLVLAVARDADAALGLGAALIHNPVGHSPLPSSYAVHDEREALAARDADAALVFISPVFPTRSHPGAPVLGPDRAAELATIAGCPAIALGGMDEYQFAALSERGFHGYAGIDCWLEPSRE